MDTNHELHLLLQDPLFANIRIPAPPISIDHRLAEKMQAINDFYQQHNRLPSAQGTTLQEKQLARSLAALKAENNPALKTFDTYNLLTL